MENTNKKSSNIIFIVIIIALLGYIGYDKFLTKEETDKKDNNTTTEEVEKTEEKKEETTIEKKEYQSLVIDESNCITDCSKVNYTIGSSIAGDGVEVWLEEGNTDRNKVVVNVNKELLKKEYLYQISLSDDSFKIEFDKKIQDIFVGNVGQDSSIPILFVLFDDGTVQYVDLYNKITTGNAKIKDLSQVKNVTKFYSASVRTKESNSTSVMTVLAQTNDGKFYDLEKYVKLGE